MKKALTQTFLPFCSLEAEWKSSGVLWKGRKQGEDLQGAVELVWTSKPLGVELLGV